MTVIGKKAKRYLVEVKKKNRKRKRSLKIARRELEQCSVVHSRQLEELSPRLRQGPHLSLTHSFSACVPGPLMLLT